jgi:hypothetical protein
MVGDSPQALIGNLSPAEAAAFIANRLTYGINALWINLLCNASTGCRSDSATFDGIAPLTVPGDLSTPNPAYFQRADDMIRPAATRGMVVILDPIETIGWLNTLKANGAARAFAYGQYLGNRYRDFPNIIRMHGNDFQSWRNPTDTGLVQAVALGIKSADPNHLHTVELNFLTSGSLDDPSWAPIIGLNAAYTYQLFGTRKWHDLIPDQAHAIVTDGRGKFSTTGSIATNTYATAGRTSGGSLVMAYMPTVRTITVDMSTLAGITTVRWFDPTNGTYVAVDGSPFANAGSRRFTPRATTAQATVIGC